VFLRNGPAILILMMFVCARTFKCKMLDDFLHVAQLLSAQLCRPPEITSTLVWWHRRAEYIALYKLTRCCLSAKLMHRSYAHNARQCERTATTEQLIRQFVVVSDFYNLLLFIIR